MKKFFILFILPLAFLTSCTDAIDDAVNDIVDAVLDYGDASAKVDGQSKKFENFSGYRVNAISGDVSLTTLYFTDLNVSITSGSSTGDAIVFFLNSDLVSTDAANEINIAPENAAEAILLAAELANNPTLGQVSVMYIQEVSSDDLISLMTEYAETSEISRVLALAAEKDIEVKTSNILEIGTAATGGDFSQYLNLKFTKTEGDKLSGEFSFKGISDKGTIDVTEGVFHDTPKDVTNLQ